MLLLQSHIVPPNIPATRLSDYAIGLFDEFPSRKSIKKAIKRGEVWIDGKPAKTGDWVQPGQCIGLYEIDRNPPKTYEFPLSVVYEDEHLAVINKPGGIVVSGNQFRTVENALLYNLKPSPEKDALKWPRPVHRLDHATCGLLVVAKTKSARIELGRQFEEKRIRKRYRAIVIGEMPEEGVIDEPIEGKEAITRFRLVRKVRSLRNGWLSLVDLFPETGRTHQLRIHMANLSFPILGDKIYGKEGEIMRGKGLFLCAVEVEIGRPRSPESPSGDSEGEVFVVREPNKFEVLLDREERRWFKWNVYGV